MQKPLFHSSSSADPVPGVHEALDLCDATLISQPHKSSKSQCKYAIQLDRGAEEKQRSADCRFN